MDDVSSKFEVTVNKFTEESSNKFQKDLSTASAIDPNHPITIYIDSYGGYVHSLMSMIESLNAAPNPIITVCKGKAMSCGAVLLSMGDRRFCGKESVVMIHEVSGGAFGNVDDIKWDAAETVRLNVQMMTILAKNCGLTYDELKAKITVDGRRDWNLTALEAKQLGIVDEVGMPLVKPIVMYSIESVPEKKIAIEKVTEPKPKKPKKATTPPKKAKAKTDTKKKKK